jgi:hypothetical protein
MANPAQLPAVAAPMALDFPATASFAVLDHHRTFYADQRTFPPPMPTPIPQNEGRCIHLCLCRCMHMCMRVEPAQEHARPCDVTMGSFSFEAPHLVVPLTWQASRPP